MSALPAGPAVTLEERTSAAGELLSLAVPLWLLRLYRLPPEQQETTRQAWLHEAQRQSEEGQGMFSEDMLFRSAKAGQTVQAFNDLARTLAALSTLPGGVTFLGDTFETTTEELGQEGAAEMSTQPETDADFDAMESWTQEWIDRHGYDRGPLEEARELAEQVSADFDTMVAEGLVCVEAGMVRVVRSEGFSIEVQP